MRNSSWLENLNHFANKLKEISKNICTFNSVHVYFSNAEKKGYYDFLWEKQAVRLNKYQEP